MKRLMITTLLAFACVNVQAAPTKPAKNPPPALPAGEVPETVAPFSKNEFDKLVKEAKARGSRGTAAVDTKLELALSDSFRNIRNEIIGGPKIADGKETSEMMAGIKTPEQLHDLLKRLNDDQYYESLSPDAKFAAAQMAPFIAAQGLFNRSMELVDGSPLTHMAVVNMLRGISAGVMVYLPTDQWEAGIKYMVLPAGNLPLIANENDVHRYIETELIPVLAKMVKRLNGLNFSSKPVYFDNKVFYGTANFADETNRYIRVGEPERHLALASGFASISGLESLNAYSLRGAFKTIDALATNTGFASALGFRPEQTTVKKRTAIVRQMNASYGLFNLRPNGKSWMQASYDNLNLAVTHGIIAWNELKARTNDTGSFGGNANSYGVALDPRSFLGAERILNAASANLTYLLSDGNDGKMQSAVVNSEGRKITLKNFFYNPPNSLMDLLPNGFDESPYNMTAKVNGKSRVWHNYLSGRPTAWPLAEYQKIFPEVKNNNDIPFTARVLSQSWGGQIVGLPLAGLVL
jgi:hypothetical protein